MNYNVKIEDAGFLALLDIKCDPNYLRPWTLQQPHSKQISIEQTEYDLQSASLPQLHNTYTESNNFQTLWIGEQHWLVKASLANESALEHLCADNILPSESSAIIISDSITWFRIHGPDADTVLSMVSPLDIHPSVFPDNGCTYTTAFGLKALLVRNKHGFDLGLDRSYTDMTCNLLTEITDLEVRKKKTG